MARLRRGLFRANLGGQKKSETSSPRVEFLKRHQWFAAGTLLVRASITGAAADIQRATDELVNAVEREGWMTRGLSTTILISSPPET
jgi:hypothetical protein